MPRFSMDQVEIFASGLKGPEGVSFRCLPIRSAASRSRCRTFRSSVTTASSTSQIRPP